jgi:hypothetical protein
MTASEIRGLVWIGPGCSFPHTRRDCYEFNGPRAFATSRRFRLPHRALRGRFALPAVAARPRPEVTCPRGPACGGAGDRNLAGRLFPPARLALERRLAQGVASKAPERGIPEHHGRGDVLQAAGYGGSV